jgi:hypothetical protein
MYCCVLVVGQCEGRDWGGQQQWNMNRTVYCVTWLLYFGRPGETLEERVLRLWAEAAIMYWGSNTLDITTAGIVGISYCLCGFGYCTVLMLAVLTDGIWKLAATYCNTIRCHHCGIMLETDPGRSTTCRMSASSTANIRVTVDSKCLNYLISSRKFLQVVYWRLVYCHAQGSVDR